MTSESAAQRERREATDPVSVSIVISSFNYARFIGDAIASALEQDGSGAEVIVVDDGSEDDSRQVISSFAPHVEAICKDNAGQASAINAGFNASNGETLIFLDADDVLLPHAALCASWAIAGGAAKAHWPMPVIDAAGRRTGAVQDRDLPHGDLRALAVEDGPLGEAAMPSPPMSGNAFARAFLEQVMPVPEAPYFTGADEYLFGLAPCYGPIVRLSSQSLYRLHGTNDHTRHSFEEKLAFQGRHYAIVEAVARERFDRDALDYDPARWRRAGWWPRAASVARDLEEHVPVGERCALLDNGALGIGNELRGRRILDFPQADGEFAGPPPDDSEALAELQRLSESGVRYFALVWTAFWWREEYPLLTAALRRGSVAYESEDLVLFCSGRV
jgi:glycosyl transferase family 2